jgi:hypothetical protein
VECIPELARGHCQVQAPEVVEPEELERAGRTGGRVAAAGVPSPSSRDAPSAPVFLNEPGA